MTHDHVPSQKRGCLFYGCLTAAGLAVVLAVVAFLGLRFVNRSVNRLISQYTDTAPVALESVRLPPAEREALQARVATFQEALESQTVARELSLSDTDLNALLAEQKDLKDRVLVRLEGDRVKGRISLPLQDVGPFKLQGRYLNGEATFRVALADGSLAVTLEDVNVKGNPLPAVVMNELKKKNLAADILRNPEAAETIARFASVQVQDGRLVLKNKVKSP
jgi:hypothetical protein